MKISVKAMAIILVGLFVAGIGGASLFGLWKTTSTKVPVAIKEGEFAGMPNPSDIRGSYTWADVAKAFSFDVRLVLTAFGATNPAEKVNTLEALYVGATLPEGSEIGTDSVRLFVSLLTGLPHVPEEGTILPMSATAVLRESGKADAALIEAAAARAYDPAAALVPTQPPAPAAAPAPVSAVPAGGTSAAAAPVPSSQTSPAPAASSTTVAADAAKQEQPAGATSEHIATVGTVTGKTTFRELKEWGLSEEEIKSATGGEIGADSLAIRDWATAKGLTFSELKAKLQELLAKK